MDNFNNMEAIKRVIGHIKANAFCLKRMFVNRQVWCVETAATGAPKYATLYIGAVRYQKGQWPFGKELERVTFYTLPDHKIPQSGDEHADWGIG